MPGGRDLRLPAVADNSRYRAGGRREHRDAGQLAPAPAPWLRRLEPPRGRGQRGRDLGWKYGDDNGGVLAASLALTWGTTGLAQAGLFTMAQVWNLPGPARPGYLQRLGRAALFLAVLGLAVIVTTLLTSLGAYGHHAIAIVVLGEALAVAANI